MMRIVRHFVLAAILLFVVVSNVHATTEVPVAKACDYNEPVWAMFWANDGTRTVLDTHEVGAFTGLIRTAVKGEKLGTLVVVSAPEAKTTPIDIYLYEGVYRNWVLVCDHGVIVRMHSDYLDCALTGMCWSPLAE